MNIEEVKKYLNENKIIFDTHKSPGAEYNVKIFLVDKKDPNFGKKRALPFSFWNKGNIDVYGVPAVKENVKFFKENTDYINQAKKTYNTEKKTFTSFGYDMNKINELYKKVLGDEIFNILFNNK